MSTYLPPELVEQIIRKLPIKSLFRFSTVSKDWHKFITPSVKKLSCRNLFLLGCSSIRNEFAFYLDNDGTWEEYARHKALGEGEELKITACGNGLMLFSDSVTEQVILWNPLIHRGLTLPELGEETRLSVENCAFGIVVDQSKDDIKILRTDDISAIEIFRMSTGKWEFHSYNVPLFKVFGCQVDLKGISYWIARDRNLTMALVSFDGRTELFSFVKPRLPNFTYNKILFLREWYGAQVLFLFDESLIFIHGENCAVENEKYEVSCQIWKMVDSEGKDWDLCWTFLFEELVRPLGFRANGEFLWAGYKTKKLISTNLKNGSKNCLGSYCAKRIFSYPNYVESLALLDADANRRESQSQSF